MVSCPFVTGLGYTSNEVTKSLSEVLVDTDNENNLSIILLDKVGIGFPLPCTIKPLETSMPESKLVIYFDDELLNN